MRHLLKLWLLAGISFIVLHGSGQANSNSDSKGIVASSAVPLKLVRFQGNFNDDKVFLEWSIANNEKADRFELERSDDGVNFSLAALVFTSESIGIENYKYYDKINKAKIYYRLKMFDKKQAVIYSNILLIENQADSNKKIKYALAR